MADSDQSGLLDATSGIILWRDWIRPSVGEYNKTALTSSASAVFRKRLSVVSYN